MRQKKHCDYIMASNIPTLLVDPRGTDWQCLGPGCTPPPGWVPEGAGCCDLKTILDDAKKLWPSGSEPYGFRKHCYICCKLGNCGGLVDGFLGYLGNILKELVEPGRDSLFDLHACAIGAGGGSHGANCRSFCDHVGDTLDDIFRRYQ